MKKQWVRMPMELLGKLTPMEVVLASVLLDYDNGGHLIRIRQRKLAEVMHCSDAAVHRAVEALEEAGVIVRRVRHYGYTEIEVSGEILPPKQRKERGRETEVRSYDIHEYEKLMNQF